MCIQSNTGQTGELSCKYLAFILRGKVFSEFVLCGEIKIVLFYLSYSTL